MNDRVASAAPANPTDDTADLMAVVDMGSNSFQLLVASFSHGQLRIVDRLREMVRLAAGLDEQSNLDEPSQQRALDCLARFGERLRDIPPERMRAVATNTLRKARNPAAFIDAAESLLGHEIDIISGMEEARLIFAGVSRTLPEVNGPHVIIDIGGGSTEIASGTAYQPDKLESLYMGCVSMSRAHFADGKLSTENFTRARTAARLELRPVVGRFRGLNWLRAAGASGTIRTAGAVLQELGLIETSITVPALENLIERMVGQGHIDTLQLPALTEERSPVFPGGVSILVEVMLQLGIGELVTAEGALREGVLYDLVGRLGDEDSRVRTVRAMESRYHVDQAQAARVEATALMFLDQVAEDWDLRQPNTRNLLRWAARMHEIGLDIAHSQYHRHGAYLLQHADMPGFNSNEQRVMAAIVGVHRRKLQAAEFANITPRGWSRRALRLGMLLRLAVLFNRSRSEDLPDLLELRVTPNGLRLRLSGSWLESNPLTLADLSGEQALLAAVDYELEIETDS